MVKISDALTITEAADIKGTTRQAIHYAIKYKGLKTVVILGRIGILPSELEKYTPTEAKIGKRNGNKRKAAKKK